MYLVIYAIRVGKSANIENYPLYQLVSETMYIGLHSYQRNLINIVKEYLFLSNNQVFVNTIYIRNGTKQVVVVAI